jgi:hypothetical protein
VWGGKPMLNDCLAGLCRYVDPLCQDSCRVE